MDENLHSFQADCWTCLERETHLHNYDCHLEEHDIAHLAKLVYGFDSGYEKIENCIDVSEVINDGYILLNKTDSRTIFEIATVNSLTKNLDTFMKYSQKIKERRPFTVALHLENCLWVLLIIFLTQTDKFWVYFVDPTGNAISEEVEDKIKSKIENVLILDTRIRQNTDVAQSGVLLLKNANDIIMVLEDNKTHVEVMQKLSLNVCTMTKLTEMRREMSTKLSKSRKRRDFCLMMFSILCTGKDIDEELGQTAASQEYHNVVLAVLEKGIHISLEMDYKIRLTYYILKNDLKKYVTSGVLEILGMEF